MNTKNQDTVKNRQPDNGSNGSKYDDQTAQQRTQQQQKKSAFDEGLMDNDEKQPSRNTDPEIDAPVPNPEKTEKKIPEMKGNNK